MAGLVDAVEVERKLDVDADVVLPDLGAVEGWSVRPPERFALDATYLDTDDLRLRAARTTLRRRTGGHDAGWHLKLPAGSDRQELRVGLQGEQVPDELARLVRARTRDRPLVPVAHLATERTVVVVCDAAGTPLAEVADDRVVARRLPDGPQLQWREWEVELLGDDRTVLDRVEAVLLGAGARPSSTASKAGRVLGPAPAPAPPRPQLDPGSGAAAVLTHLAEQVEELLARDPQVRLDAPDAVHRMRVATRRLRSALSTFRSVLDRSATRPLRGELRALARVLGDVRDLEVVHARLVARLDAEPPDLVLGRVRDRLDGDLRRQAQDARARLLAELAGERYLRLLDDLEALLAAPPLLPGAEHPAAEVLAGDVRRRWRRLARRMRAAERSGDPAALHEVRKEAKRARYAAEAAGPVLGRRAARAAKAASSLQDLLGELQDSVAARAVLRQLGARGHLAGQNGFTFGRLHGLEQAQAAVVDPLRSAAWARAARRRHRRWDSG